MNTTEVPAKLTHNEDIKAAIPTLAGTIAATLNDAGADHFSEDDNQFLKFHGSYQQDDRDLRKTGKKYIMMVRGRIPGRRDDRPAMAGVRPARHDLWQQHAPHHHPPEHPVPRHPEIRPARGDQEHQRVAALHPGRLRRREPQRTRPAHAGLHPGARRGLPAIASAWPIALRPQTKAYHSIWIDGTQLNLDDPANKDFVDPLYGKTYLPRKFKVAFVIPPVNDLDVFTNCLGFIAIVENDKLTGYNICRWRRHGPQSWQ